MGFEDIIAHAAALDGVLVLRPGPNDGSPPISWGDAFIYYAPGGAVPPGQPFATIVTKDYPDEPPSGLDEPGAYRLNIAVPRADFVRVLGAAPADAVAAGHDARVRDAWFPHPVYGRAGWLSVVNPDARLAEARRLLGAAHAAARARHERRSPAPEAG